MHQFLIENKHRDNVLKWCLENMDFSRQYNWFPFYVTLGGQEAFRLDIFDDECAVFFNLIWGENISNDSSQPRPCKRSR